MAVLLPQFFGGARNVDDRRAEVAPSVRSAFGVWRLASTFDCICSMLQLCIKNTNLLYHVLLLFFYSHFITNVARAANLSIVIVHLFSMVYSSGTYRQHSFIVFLRTI